MISPKSQFFLIVLAYIVLMLACHSCKGEEINVERFADAIRRAEGDRYYGVRSIPVHSEAEARRVCINSIRNNIKRWERSGRTNSFYQSMGARWCPIAADPIGNRNWTNNVRQIYEAKK
jgi:hypothetical protein